MGYQPKYDFDGKPFRMAPLTRREKIEAVVALVVLSALVLCAAYGLALMLETLSELNHSVAQP